MRQHRKLGITRGISYSFAILIALFALHGIFSFESIRQMAGLVKTIHDHPLVVSNASLQANNNIIKMHRSMKDVVLFNDPAVFDSAVKEVDGLEAETYKQLQAVQENILGAKGEQVATEAVQLFKEWKPIRDRVIGMTRNGDRKNAALITREEGAAHVARLESKMLELTAYARNKAEVFLNDTETGYSRAKIESLLLMIFFVALCSGIAVFTLRRTRNLERNPAEEKERLIVTLKSIGDGVIATDKTGAVILLNPVAEELTGWREHEVAGKSIQEGFKIVNEETREPCMNPVEKILATGAVIVLANHTVLIARDDDERPIADSGAPIKSANGKVMGTVLVFRDQTDEREYQNRIRESEKRFRLLSDNTLDLIWAMNLDFELTYVNRAISNLTGYSPEEWIGSPLSEHMVQEDLAEISRVIEAELAKGPTGKRVTIETSLLDKNRRAVPVEVHGRVIYDDSGQPVGLQGVSRDISERKQSEAERRHQDLLLREMGDIARIGAWEFNPVTGVGTWAEEVARIHDLDPGAETNTELGMSFYQGESRAKIETAIREAIELGKPYDLELEMATAKGVHKWARTIGRPVMENGVVVQIRGSFQDITVQKLGEQRIEHLNLVLQAIREVNQLIVRERNPDTLIQEGCRMLFDNRGYASALIFLVDENDRPVSWGRAGLAAASVSLNTQLEQNLLPSCCNSRGSGFKVVLKDDRHENCGRGPIAEDCGDIHTLCVPLVHDEEFFGYLIVALARDLSVDNEEKDLLTEISKDISYALKTIRMEQAREESEHQRESLESQLIQAQKLESVGRLAGGVAHDYNNMLGVIIGNAELALGKVESGNPLHHDLEEILAAAKRSAEITRQLLHSHESKRWPPSCST